MDAKENKTDETPASLQLGLVEAQQVTLTDNNKIKQNKDPGHVTAEKNLPNTTAEWERKRRRKEAQSNTKIQRIQALEGQAPN